MNGISNISPTATGQATTVGKPVAEAGAGFGEALKNTIAGVNNRMVEAEQLATGLVSGEHSNIHETMIAMEKANISFRLLAKVHTKVISAYQEIIRMQV